MAITFRQLEHFLALSEELHFGNAARKLNISQPPLSASLKQLEDHLGFPLMIRSNRSVRLTAAGVVFARHAARLLSQLKQAEVIAAQTAKGATGRLSVGSVPSMLFLDLPAILRQFKDAHPQVELVLHELNTAPQLERVVKHELDVGFIHDVPRPDVVEECLIETQRLVCCLPREHRLAGRSQISLDQLAGENFLVFAREYAEANFDRISKILEEHGLKPYTDYQLRNWFTVVALVGQELGVAIVPAILARMNLGNVVYVDFQGENTEHSISMIWHRESGNEVVREFIRFVKNSEIGYASA
ncbi:LysR family transcriptional regulator [Amorphus sp. 3PC139-8]|uniref:LysR family transcriptional regulator n=1 Tax=Amorphus sp. 3PC139-8 TaxID=2735676 RepID=UPI00345D3692